MKAYVYYTNNEEDKTTMTETKFMVEYTNKDIMEKLDSIDNKLHSVHEMAKVTNGTVKLHTKLIWGAYGFTFASLCMAIKLLL